MGQVISVRYINQNIWMERIEIKTAVSVCGKKLRGPMYIKTLIQESKLSFNQLLGVISPSHFPSWSYQ